MANNERIGGCLWRLFQVGLVLALLAVGLVVVISLDLKGEREEAGLEQKEEKEEGGIVGAVKRLFGFGGEEEVAEILKEIQEEQAEGHIALKDLLRDRDKLNEDRAVLAEGTTSIDQLVLWQVIGDDIYYRIILTPYDRTAHQMMLDPGESLFISFVDANQVRLAPRAAAAPVPTKDLRVATGDGYAIGWFADGKVPLEGQDGGLVEAARVGWIFSDPLHARLRRIQRPEAGRDSPVKDPFGVDTGVE